MSLSLMRPPGYENKAVTPDWATKYGRKIEIKPGGAVRLDHARQRQAAADDAADLLASRTPAPVRRAAPVLSRAALLAIKEQNERDQERAVLDLEGREYVREVTRSEILPSSVRLVDAVQPHIMVDLGLRHPVTVRWFRPERATERTPPTGRRFAVRTVTLGQAHIGEPDAVWIRSTHAGHALVRTLAHELCHVKQMLTYPEAVMDACRLEMERDAYDYADRFVAHGV
jgi:hypothetical protein